MTEPGDRIIIGCDHGAFALKETIKAWLESQSLPVEDIGTHDETSVHYPEYGRRVAEAVSRGAFERGILLCGTGLGMSMVANRFPGVRAALCTEPFAAEKSRSHNNANVLVLGGRVTGPDLAVEIVKTWLKTPFDGGRHQQRLDMFDRLT
jgi:ribose 5-phosphate isomerase B